jgi:thermostable 8-oxoguanine DNA glycosylase
MRISSKKDSYKLLSQICQQVYYKTPIFKNELVNKQQNFKLRFTLQRKNYLRSLVDNWNNTRLRIASDNKFPPEKNYLSYSAEGKWD